jgi:Tfp pilus assembly protein PilP
MPDLKNWLAAATRQIASKVIKVSLPPAQAAPAPAIASARRIQPDRDPFAPPIERAVAASDAFGTAETKGAEADVSATASASGSLHMLGTVHDGGIAYALIKADRQVFCVAPHAPLPSYPLTVAAVTDHAVELEQRLQDGSMRRSTLRLGE